MTATCDLCRATFPDEAELAKHVEMEESIDWPIDGETAPEREWPTRWQQFRAAYGIYRSEGFARLESLIRAVAFARSGP